MNTDLTILLLLKDRTPFTWRWFEFYNQIGLPFKVLVADGGEDKSVEKLRDKSLFPNINYEYVRFPFDKDYEAFFKKIVDALSFVKTKYVLFASNDDFYFADTLMASVKFLEANPDYSTARGDIYNFSIKQSKKTTGDEDVYGQMTNIHKLYFNTSNTAATAVERVEVFSQYSNSLWHDVGKTNKLKEFYKNLCELKIEDMRFSEYFLNAMTVALGKVHREAGLHMLHQAQSDSVSTSIKGDPIEWIMSEYWANNFLKMASAISKQIAYVDSIEQDRALQKFIQYYIANSLGKNMITTYVKKMSAYSFFNLLNLSHVVGEDNAIRKTLKKLYLSTKSFWQNLKNLRTIQRSPYYKKIKMVEDFLNKNEF